MEFGIFNLMGSRYPEKPTAEVVAEVAEQTRLADELGYAIAWFEIADQPAPVSDKRAAQGGSVIALGRGFAAT